jgi:hypothetical protein
MRYILLTGESRFCLDFTDRCASLEKTRWRVQAANIAEHDRCGGGSVMVWVGISWNGRSDLVARRHTAKMVQVYIERESIDRMDWSARSSDLNPREHMRNELQVRSLARQLHPRTIQEFWAMLVQELAVIPSRNRIRNMRRCCQAVIIVKGHVHGIKS